MAKLTDTQLIVLSKAAERDDGAAGIPDRMNKAAAAKIGGSLVVGTGLRKRGFAIERIRHERLGSLYRIVGDQTASVGS
jgi:hypothetical protein